MTAEFLHPDLVRFAFILGVAVSITFYDHRHLTTGGIAVPAYLSFSIFIPLLAPLIFTIALLTFFVVHIVMPRIFILSASAKFSFQIIVSSAFHLALDIAYFGAVAADDNEALLRGLGYVVPGLISHDFSRHGIATSTKNILLTSSLVAVVLFAIVHLMPDLGRFYPSQGFSLYPVSLQATPLLVLLSLIAWVGLTRFCDFRCGGFLGGAFLTLLILQPEELLFFAIAALVTIGIVKYLIEPHTILFGRRKFAAHILVGGVLSWIIFIVRESVFASYTISTVTPSLAVVGVLLTGLLASDIERVGIGRTAIGIMGSVAFTLIGTLCVVDILFHGVSSYTVPMLLALVAMVSITVFGVRRARTE